MVASGEGLGQPAQQLQEQIAVLAAVAYPEHLSRPRVQRAGQVVLLILAGREHGLLVGLAIPPGHPGAVAAAEDALRWLMSPEHRRKIRAVGGLIRQHATQEGLALAACCLLGMAHDPRVGELVDSLLRSQWPDGGWNCDPQESVTHSSFHETIGPLWGLAEYERATSNSAARDSADRAAEFFLGHRLFRSHRTGRVAHPEYVKLHYPPYWHYDILFGLLVLSRAARSWTQGRLRP